MNTEGNDPAFPDSNNSGITKREYFAAKALQGILSDPEEIKSEGYEEESMEEGESDTDNGPEEMENRRRDGESCLECACRLAVEHADMLIRQLNK